MSSQHSAAGLGVNAANALKLWEMQNNVETTTDKHYTVNVDLMKRLQKERPWKKDPKYFKSIKISALALLKIVMHAKTGRGQAGSITTDSDNWIEIMGLTQGYFGEGTLVITDSFGLPTVGSEVEAAMNEESIFYMLNYIESSEKLGKKEGCVGWYHSHPGYTCFMSGMDVNTQTLNQTAQDPWIALVTDPIRTISTGKVEIKAFRTYPEGYEPQGDPDFDREQLPPEKIEEFGVHMKRYYELPITVYRSNADAEQLNRLWNRYWQQTLATSPLLTNRLFTDKQVMQVSNKLSKAQDAAAHGEGGGFRRKGKTNGSTTEGGIAAVSQSVSTVSNDTLQGLMGMLVKQQIFNSSTAPGTPQ